MGSPSEKKPSRGRAFEVDEAKYARRSIYKETEPTPKFSAWSDFKFSVGGLLALLFPFALIAAVIWLLLF
jgi:hypothetical protein